VSDPGLSDRVAGIVVALIGMAIGIEASTFDVMFMTDPVGPKALPYLAAAIMLLGGLGIAVRPRVSPEWPGRMLQLRLVASVLAFMVYAIALGVIGFFVSTTLVVATLSLLYGGPPKKSWATAASLSAALWLLFVQVLGLPLPIGSLWIR